jgi:acetyl esterase/lipase
MKEPGIPHDVRCETDLVFRTDTHPPLDLDLFWHPESKTPTPVVLWFFSGGWRHGDKRRREPALHLLKHGFALACPDYRMSWQAVFPAQIEDAKAAARWVRGMANHFNIDAHRIGVWGESAGGYLSAMLGVSANVKKWDETGPFTELSSSVQAVCDWAGPSDFYRLNEPPCDFDHDSPDSYESRLLGAPIREIPEKVKAASPMTYIHEKAPPFLVMHGTRDKTIVPGQSRLLHDALVEKGVDSQLLFLDGYGHELKFNPRTEAIDPAIRFFKKHLRP